MGRENKWILCWNYLFGQVAAVSRLICTHVVRDVKLDAQRKRFVLTTLSRFIGLCRVSLACMVLMDKNLREPGPEKSVHPGVTLSFLFFLSLFM